MRFVSFFAGIGGIDLGLERAGHTCVGQVEIEPYCLRVLAKHWPDVWRWKDIRDLKAEEIPDTELYVGGDPCQANSRARGPWGTRKAALSFPFLRIIDARRPRFVLRENPSRVRRDAPWPWQRFRDHLEGIGYVVLPFRLRACCLGADHQRERVLLLAEYANALRPRLERRRQCGVSETALSTQQAGTQRPTVSEVVELPLWLRTRPPNLRASDGFSRKLDRYPIEAIGNSVQPQVAEYIGRLLKEAE